jgi:hypothetical protein
VVGGRGGAHLVVLVLDLAPPQAFELVDLLLLLEDLDVEVLLDLLVGEVDAELLEAVLLEDLEAGDVQDADDCARRERERMRERRRTRARLAAFREGIELVMRATSQSNSWP